MSTYKRRFGDRKEGRLLRSLPAFSKFIPYIMPTRNDASNQYEESFEVSDVDRRLRQLRVQGYKGIGILHLSSLRISAACPCSQASTASSSAAASTRGMISLSS